VANAVRVAAGFFYAYHVSVTRGHALIGDRAYVEAMQAINATVRNLEFAVGFFGALVLGAAALALRAGRWRSPTTWLVAAGVGLYLAAFLVTMTVNVPMNEELSGPTWPRSGPTTSPPGTGPTPCAPACPSPPSPSWSGPWPATAVTGRP